MNIFLVYCDKFVDKAFITQQLAEQYISEKSQESMDPYYLGICDLELPPGAEVKYDPI